MITKLTEVYYKTLLFDYHKGRIYRIYIRLLAHYLLPLYLKYFKKNRYCLVAGAGDDIVVSLTTFPKRINTIWIVLECMLRQTKKPDRIILWLSQSQFRDKSFLPKKILAYENLGVEFRIVDGADLRSHKKYYYVLKEFPNSIIVTIDDDFIYPLTLLEDLYQGHIKFPNKIIANRALLKKYDNANNLLPYNKWENLVLKESIDRNVFFTSGGGTLFSAKMLAKEVYDKDVFMKICKNADDVWLNFMANRNNTLIFKVHSSNLIIPIDIKDNESLMDSNVTLNENDEQIRRVEEYYL